MTRNRMFACLICLMGAVSAQTVPQDWESQNLELPRGIALYRTQKPGLRAWLVRVDLGGGRFRCEPIVSKAKSGQERVGSLLEKSGAILGVNASPFVRKEGTTTVDGWLQVKGRELSAAPSRITYRDQEYTVARAALIWRRTGVLSAAWVHGRNGKAFLCPAPIPNENLKPAPSSLISNEMKALDGVVHGLSAGPMLVRSGKIAVTRRQEVLFPHRDDRAPRTAIGLDGSTLYLLVVDGRSKTSRGASLEHCARMLSAWGAKDALNLGGGSASTLVVNGKLVNRPAGRARQRRVPVALGIFGAKDKRPSAARK